VVDFILPAFLLAWKQVVGQVQLLVCDIIAACSMLTSSLMRSQMALDAAALVVQIMGVTGTLFGYGGASLAVIGMDSSWIKMIFSCAEGIWWPSDAVYARLK
jgi:hypothetical protein